MEPSFYEYILHIDRVALFEKISFTVTDRVVQYVSINGMN